MSDLENKLIKHSDSTQTPHKGLLSKYNAPDAKHQLMTDLISEASDTLWLVTYGTDIQIQPEEIFSPSSRLKLAHAIQAKSSAPLDKDTLDSHEINFAIKSLSNSAIVNHQLDYDPANDDICILSAVSSAIVKGVSEGIDSRVLILDTLHALLNEAQDHGLEIILNQIRTLQRSEDQLHRNLSADILAFLADHFLKYEDHEIPEIRADRQHVYRNYKQIATMTLPQIAMAIVNPESRVGDLIRDHVLLSSVIEHGGLSIENLAIIRGLCRLIEIKPSFDAIDEIRLNLFPSAKIQDRVEKIKVTTFDVISDENEDDREESIANENNTSAEAQIFHTELISDELDQDEDF